MALTHRPDRVRLEDPWPTPRDAGPPYNYDPPTADAGQSPDATGRLPWWVRIAVWAGALMILIALGLLWLIGIPTRIE